MSVISDWHWICDLCHKHSPKAYPDRYQAEAAEDRHRTEHRVRDGLQEILRDRTIEGVEIVEAILERFDVTPRGEVSAWAVDTPS